MKIIENYTIRLETFLFQREWLEKLVDLSDEEAGRLIKCISDYTCGIEALPSDPKTRATYRLITEHLNSSAFGYLRKTGKLNDPDKN